MDYLIHQLLNKESCKRICNEILSDTSNWQDGKKTAGSHAAILKNNLQLKRDSKKSKEVSSEITNKLLDDSLVKSFCLPKKIHGIMFSQSKSGHGYGAHVDNPYMSSGRSDLSFTLFLSSKDDYIGGSLNIQTLQENKKFKLESGQIIIYPSTSIHSVEKITGGQRIVCIGWIESYITSSEDRNLLFGLDAGAKGLLATYGQSDQLNLVFQAYNNLLRRLGA